jgi:hypothetical protein
VPPSAFSRWQGERGNSKIDFLKKAGSPSEWIEPMVGGILLDLDQRRNLTSLGRPATIMLTASAELG